MRQKTCQAVKLSFLEIAWNLELAATGSAFS